MKVGVRQASFQAEEKPEMNFFIAEVRQIGGSKAGGWRYIGRHQVRLFEFGNIIIELQLFQQKKSTPAKIIIIIV